MSAIKSQHSRMFEQLVAARRQRIVDALLLSPPEDYAGYRQLVGQVAGLDEALSISEEADFSISGDETNAGA